MENQETTSILPAAKAVSGYEITEQLSKLLRKYFGTKAFVQVADVIQLIQKKVLTEKEIDLVINRVGEYPYDEVEEIFGLFSTNIKLVELKESEKSSTFEEQEKQANS